MCQIRISLHARSLAPLVKTRVFGMTPSPVIREFKLSHYRERIDNVYTLVWTISLQPQCFSYCSKMKLSVMPAM